MTWQLAALVRWLVVPSGGIADAAIQMPLSKMPLTKCLLNPLDRRAALAMTDLCWIATA